MTIGNGVTSIGDYAFYDCDKLVEVINKSSLNIKARSSDYGYVGYYAKVVHKGESPIVNKNGYLFITSDDGTNYLVAYTGDDSELILPNNYNGENYKIYDYAFYNCTSLTSVTIPDSVTSIYDSAFEYCTGLKSVIFENPNGWWYSSSSSATSGKNISGLDDTSMTAKYLRYTYADYYWMRG